MTKFLVIKKSTNECRKGTKMNKVLIIDDDKDLCILLKRVFQLNRLKQTIAILGEMDWLNFQNKIIS